MYTIPILCLITFNVLSFMISYFCTKGFKLNKFSKFIPSMIIFILIIFFSIQSICVTSSYLYIRDSLFILILDIFFVITLGISLVYEYKKGY